LDFSLFVFWNYPSSNSPGLDSMRHDDTFSNAEKESTLSGDVFNVFHACFFFSNLSQDLQFCIIFTVPFPPPALGLVLHPPLGDSTPPSYSVNPIPSTFTLQCFGVVHSIGCSPLHFVSSSTSDTHCSPPYFRPRCLNLSHPSSDTVPLCFTLANIYPSFAFLFCVSDPPFPFRDRSSHECCFLHLPSKPIPPIFAISVP